MPVYRTGNSIYSIQQVGYGSTGAATNTASFVNGVYRGPLLPIFFEQFKPLIAAPEIIEGEQATAPQIYEDDVGLDAGAALIGDSIATLESAQAFSASASQTASAIETIETSASLSATAAFTLIGEKVVEDARTLSATASFGLTAEQTIEAASQLAAAAAISSVAAEVIEAAALITAAAAFAPQTISVVDGAIALNGTAVLGIVGEGAGGGGGPLVPIAILQEMAAKLAVETPPPARVDIERFESLLALSGRYAVLLVLPPGLRELLRR